jgi:drug/metabolite transporter (DMT)-like permease
MSLTRAQANVLIVIAAACWGFSNVPQKQVLEHVGPFMAVGLRCLFGAVILSPFILRERRSRTARQKLPRGSFAAVVLLFTLGMTAQQTAYGGTSVINGSFLVNTATVLTPLAAWLLHRTVPDILIGLAVILSFAGAALMIGGGFTTIAWGDAMMLLAAAVFALWYVVQGDAVVRSGMPATLTLLQFIAAAILCLALALIVERPSLAAVTAALPDAALLGCFGTGLSFALLSLAQRYTSASEAAILCSGEAIFGMLGGMLAFGESLAFGPATGAVLIGLAIMLVQIGPTLLPTSGRRGRETVVAYQPEAAD